MNFTIQSLVYNTFNQITTWAVTLISAASVLVFIFGIVRYLFKGSSKTEREKGRKFMLWGIIGLFVMFSVWGILAILTSVYGGTSLIPQFKSPIPSMDKLGDQKIFTY